MCSCKQKPRGRLVATARLNQVSVKSFAEYFTHVYQAVATQTKPVPTATMPAMAVNANTNARSFSSEIRANRLKVGRKIRIIKPKTTTVLHLHDPTLQTNLRQQHRAADQKMEFMYTEHNLDAQRVLLGDGVCAHCG